MAKDEKKDDKPKESKEQLLKKLETTEDQAEKRRIRARLRTLGHEGGLNKPRAEKKKAEKPAKGKRAKAAA